MHNTLKEVKKYISELSPNERYCIMLCGLPGSGKSTFRTAFKTSDFIANPTQLVTLSTDQYIEGNAVWFGLTYNEIFQKQGTLNAEKFLESWLDYALVKRKNIIWDQTNLTAKSRYRKLNRIPKDYKKICVVFLTDFDLILQRNKERKSAGRDVPVNTLWNMKEQFEQPSHKEGFEFIIKGNW